jgi:polysaccharide biosynthesis transport protein
VDQPAVSAPVTDAPGFDPKAYLRILYRQKWLVSLIFLAVVGSVALYTMRQPKVYSAGVSLIIDMEAPRFLDRDVQNIEGGESSANYWASKEYYETQGRIITSRAVSRRVVEKLGLNSDPAFLGLEKVVDPKVRAQWMQDSDATGILQGKIQVSAIRDTRVTMVYIQDSDPNRAALLANEVADAYVQENLALKLRVTENASQWLDERRETLEQSSKGSELAVYNFKRQQDMLTTSLEDRQSMVSQRLVATNAALTDIRLRITGLKARVTAIRSVQQGAKEGDPLWADALPAAEKPLVMDLKTKLMTMRNDCAELKTRYLDGFPKLTSCTERARELEKDLVRELNNLVVAAEAELREATEKERLLNMLFEQTKTEAFEVNKKQLDFDRLKREDDQNRRLYDLVFKRIKDIELSGMVRTSNVRVLDAARPMMGPIKPNVTNNMMLAVAFGLLLGAVGAVFFESLNSTLSARSDIEERLGLSFLGIVPSIPEDVAVQNKDLFIHHKPKSMVAEFTRAIRTNLLFMSPDKPFRTMVVTSSGPQEGKSTTCINLGIAMAQSGSKVLLIDTDMRRPRLHRAFGVAAEFGVSTVVVGECTPEQAIKTTEVSNLFLLPCGPVPPNPAELLHTIAFKELLAKLSEKFDRIILDSPPIGAVADAVVLSTQVDGVLLVIKAGKTQREVARSTVRALRDVNARIFGAVFDDIDPEETKYGGYYGYGYYAYGTEADKKKEA